MKKSIAATALVATLTASALVAGCGSPTTVAQPPAVRNATSDVSAPILTPEEQVLQEMWRQANVGYAYEIAAGQSSQQTLQVIDQIEEAQRSLQGLEETRQMIHAVMGNQVASGQLSFEQMEAALRDVDEASQAVLARVGLVP